MVKDDLESRLTEIMARSSFSGVCSVVVDYELQPGDCRIEWDGGGADRDEARIWRDIRAAIAATLGDIDPAALEAAADALAPAATEAPS